MGNNVLTEGKTPPIPIPPAKPTNSTGFGEMQNGLTSNIAPPPPPPKQVNKK